MLEPSSVVSLRPRSPVNRTFFSLQSLTLENVGHIITSFFLGLRDVWSGISIVWNIKWLSGMEEEEEEEKKNTKKQRDAHKEYLLNRESPGRDMVSLAKRRAMDRRERMERPQAQQDKALALKPQTTPERSSASVPPMQIARHTFKIAAINLAVLISCQFLMEWLLGSLEFMLAGQAFEKAVKPLQLLIHALWVMPVYILTRIINVLWFQDVASEAFKVNRVRAKKVPSLSTSLADPLVSIVVETLFLGEGLLFLKLLPFQTLGWWIYILHLSILHSLYSFEYKWFQEGHLLNTRIALIENNWPYFVGFGLPMALATTLVDDFVVSGCIFAVLFPQYIISGTKAQVHSKAVNISFSFFGPTLFFTNQMTVCYQTAKNHWALSRKSKAVARNEKHDDEALKKKNASKVRFGSSL